MIPLSLMMLIYLVVFWAGVLKYFSYFQRGHPSPFGVWIISLLAAVIGVSYPMVVSTHHDTPDIQTLYLTMGLLLAVAMGAMLTQRTPQRQVRKGLIVSESSTKAIAKIHREKRARSAEAAAQRPPGEGPLASRPAGKIAGGGATPARRGAPAGARTNTASGARRVLAADGKQEA